jgi:hypothetical protein
MDRRLQLFGVAVGVVVALALAWGLGGCSVTMSTDEPVGAGPVDQTQRLGDHVDLSLPQLLAKPRQELAELCDEWVAKIRVLEKAHRDTTVSYLLLPELHVPLAVPVLREAKFSPHAGFSLPPYLADGAKDTDLALHLARFGDVEAARKLAQPGDADILRRIDKLSYERNYPVEWARLAGLMLHAAQLRLATGDPEGGTELLVWHRELKTLLGPKAAHGPLGAALLPRGHRALQQAVAAWRLAKQSVLVEQANAALKEWGEMPPPPVSVPLGSTRPEVARLFGARGEGRALALPSMPRVLDVLALPLPDEGVEAVLTFFDGADRLSEVLLVYRARTNDHFPEPSDLAHQLQEALQTTAGVDSASGLRRLTYPLGDVNCEVNIVSRSGAVGGLVRLLGNKAVENPAVLPRDFGAVHFNRSFEQNRLRLTPGERGGKLESDEAAVVGRVTSPPAVLRPALVSLERDAEQDVVQRLTLTYAVEQATPPLAKVALPLWAAWGPGHFDAVEDEHGGQLAWVWEDAQTRCTLRVPHAATEAATLEVRDRHEPKDQAQRAAAAAAVDRAERQARFTSGKLLTRLPRYVEFAQLPLGMPRGDALQTLPGGKNVLTRNLPDGVTVIFTGAPPKNTTAMARQLFLRFNAANRLAEVRVRYEDVAQGKGSKDLLAALKKKGGAPLEAPAPGAVVWSDLTAGKPAAVLSLWQDDATLLTCQRDAGGVEVAVRDCPADQEKGVALPPLEYLPHGPEKCPLGETRDALLRKWKVKEPVTTSDGALVLRPDKGDVYEAFLVWFDMDKVVRVVAQHAQTGTAPAQPAQLAAALSEAWGRDLKTLGWPRRQDLTGEVVSNLGWNDERTRVRSFWQESEQGPPRIFTEWKEVKVVP